MAETLSYNDMIGQAAELQRKNHFLLSWSGDPNDAYLVWSTQLPSFSINEVEDDWMNTKRYYAGRITYDTMPITLKQPLAPSAAQRVYEWVRLCTEPESGRMGYKDVYARNITLKLLAPDGTVTGTWELQRAWPTQVSFGDVDMHSDGDFVEISMTLRYDRAIPNPSI